MVKLFDISKLRYYVANHSSKKFSKMSKNILFDFDHFGHFWMSCPDNTKFRKFSKIGVWSYLGGPYGHEGMVCQSGACAGFTQWSEGSSEPPSLWVYHHVRRQNAQNTVFCKLIIIVYFNYIFQYHSGLTIITSARREWFNITLHYIAQIVCQLVVQTDRALADRTGGPRFRQFPFGSGSIESPSPIFVLCTWMDKL
jgi:hypothetical protein